ncbi:hypothetical protein [Streptomyces sp. NPDC059786]|uniref:hypothetical protein n=1 Tax=Streptomyces sp. NPDC059786 TaxID=3346946 RepID=UPI003648DFCD
MWPQLSDVAKVRALEMLFTAYVLRLYDEERDARFATAAQRGSPLMVRIARQGGWTGNSTSLARYFDEGVPWEDNPVIGL